jgi:outer membrane immunogenic protein
VPVYNWTACFVGGSGGGLVTDKDWMDTRPVAARGRSFGGQSFTGALGAVQFGCDYQAGSFVIGAQGDFAWTDADASTNNLLISTLGNREHVKSLTSGTVRVGYAWDRLMAYARGGGAWERVDYELYTLTTGAVFASASETRSGWTVGAGFEAIVLPGVSAFVEASYYDFGAQGIRFLPATGAAIQADARAQKECSGSASTGGSAVSRSPTDRKAGQGEADRRGTHG